jgi:hypothetical protein
MRTYEKPSASGSQGSKYTGSIAVICLFASMLAAWALMRTSPDVTPSRTVTTGAASSTLANR